MTSQPTPAKQDFDVTAVEWDQFELFRGMDTMVIRSLVDTMDPIEAEPGAVLIRQGDDGDAMFLLQEGTVGVRIEDKDGKVRFDGELEAPAVFGEMALVTRDPRTATVSARTPVRCLRVDKHTFARLVRKNPPAAAFLTRAVGKRLMDANGIRQVGKYEVAGHLGKGGLATVFEAMHPELGQPVALKMLWHHFVLRRGFAEAFKREARLIAGLRHPHIVRVIDTEKAYGTHFIVMERLSGRGLDELIEREEHLPWKVVRRILIEVLDALEYCHQKGLLHRDVKPSNIFLTEEGASKLLDFNIAVTTTAALEATGEAVGTPNFMAPEQVLGQPMDGRTDLYGLGITAYQIATGDVPFLADTLAELKEHQVATPLPDPRTLAPDVPEDLVHFILKATAKVPDDRFASCAEAADFLRRAVELPFVDRLELTSLAVSYHPSRRREVGRAMRRLYDELQGLAGVAVVYGHRRGADDDDESVAAPRTRAFGRPHATPQAREE